MAGFSNQRSIAPSPDGSILALSRHEVWQMMPDFSWERRLLGLPHHLGFPLGLAGQLNSLEWAEEIVYDRAGRLFIFDRGNDAIIVDK
jgi:hypothetical protein